MLYRLAQRSGYGIAVYIGLNIGLVIAELIWHPIEKIATLDVTALRYILAHILSPR